MSEYTGNPPVSGVALLEAARKAALVAKKAKPQGLGLSLFGAAQAASSPQPMLPLSAPDSADVALAPGRVASKHMAPVDEMFDFVDSQKTKSGKYPVKNLKGLAQAARAIGVDPYELVAASMQEDGMGTAGRSRYFGNATDLTDEGISELAALQEKTGLNSKYLRMALAHRDKLKEGQRLGYADRAHLLQAYNGYGIVTKDRAGSDKIFGVPIGNGLSMKQNPLHGKRIMALASDLRRSAAVQKLLTELK